jgi:hypothetical protein
VWIIPAFDPIRSEFELCGCGDEFLISMRMWMIRIRLCADADYDMVLVLSDGYRLSDNRMRIIRGL